MLRTRSVRASLASVGKATQFEKLPPADIWLPFEQTGQKRVILHAHKQASHRPDEHATCPVRGRCDDIVGGESDAGVTTNAKINQDGSHPRREGDNDAARLLAETARSPEGIDWKPDQLERFQAKWKPVRVKKTRQLKNLEPRFDSIEAETALVSGVDFPVEIAKVGQSFHRQAVFVLFARDVLFHQMLGKALAGSLGLGTVCKRAVDAQRAING